MPTPRAAAATPQPAARTRAPHAPGRGARPKTKVRLAAVWAYTLIALVALVALIPGSASAHPLSTTAVLLDIGAHEVTGRVQLPIDRLAIAFDQPLTAASVMQPAELADLRGYVRQHTSAATQSPAPATPAGTPAPPGPAWAVEVSGGQVEQIDGVDHLVFDLALRPADGNVTDFTFTYDAIVHRLLSHKVFVSVRAAGSQTYTTDGLIDWQTHSVAVPAAGAGTETGFAAAVHLGIEHISGGADHLLFLFMLLLPAPLVARRRRWARSDDLRRSCWRVVHVVTAFAIGHSLTLALATLGYVQLPTRPVESMIAVSILVSGIHAVKPLVPGGEAWIAAGFGLMHGLAFAALIDDLGLSTGSLVANLLGFNLGIELTQLMVVALVMPSLLLLSRTRSYPAVRVSLAAAGIVLATFWLAERTTLLAHNPLEGASETLFAHPFLLFAALAAAAVSSTAVQRLKPDISAAPSSPPVGITTRELGADRPDPALTRR